MIDSVVGSQMYISRLSSEDERTIDLARLGVINEVGMIFGSSVGGFVTGQLIILSDGSLYYSTISAPLLLLG